MTRKAQKAITTEEINSRLEAINARGAKIQAAIDSWLKEKADALTNGEICALEFFRTAEAADITEEERAGVHELLASRFSLIIWPRLFEKFPALKELEA